ncbi:phage tail protein [Paraburkholderia sp. BR14374]|uniref:phage tail protein n=1 Tax=Paraburkholderia sp. BR14374 TaxID=3237007 RepID=UPI0034CFB83A
MPAVFRPDPYAGYCFEVIVTGISNDGKNVKGSFMEVAGLGSEVPPIEYRNGSEDISVRKIPGLKKFTNITLKWGVTADLTFWNWILQGMNGTIQRTNGSIVLLDEQRQEVMRWNFTRAWPCKYTGPGLNAKNNEIAIETLEICHEGLSVDGQA